MRININKEDIKNISVMELSTMWTLTVTTTDGAKVDFTLNSEHIEYLLEEIATQKKIRLIMDSFSKANA